MVKSTQVSYKVVHTTETSVLLHVVYGSPPILSNRRTLTPLKWSLWNPCLHSNGWAVSISPLTNDPSHCVSLTSKHPIIKRVNTILHPLSSPGCRSHIPCNCLTLLKCQSRQLMHCDTLIQDNDSTVRGDGGSRVGEVRAGTTTPMPEHKGFKLQ